jgi:peptidoglycan/xylan/chitin deacetylase (PgdA/CDA1 family)
MATPIAKVQGNRTPLSTTITVASAGLAGAALWCGPGLAVHAPPVAAALGLPLRLEHGAGVALTYDDGPHPDGTPAVLEALREQGVKATFFLVGEQVERYPHLAAQIAQEGHEPAVHGFRHRNQMRLTPHAFVDDLEHGLTTIADACGQTPTWYRPPYGVFTLTGLAAVRRRGLRPQLWSKWGRDWRTSPPDEIARLATRNLVDRDVILLHDADWYGSSGSHRGTAKATPAIVEKLRDRGLSAVTLSRAAA